MRHWFMICIWLVLASEETRQWEPTVKGCKSLVWQWPDPAPFPVVQPVLVKTYVWSKASFLAFVFFHSHPSCHCGRSLAYGQPSARPEVPNLFSTSQSSFPPAGRAGGFQRGAVLPLCLSWQSFWHRVRLMTTENVCARCTPCSAGQE